MKQNNFVFRQKVFNDYRDGSINNIVNYGDDGTTQLPRKKAPKFDADAHVFLNKSYIYLNSTPDERGKEKPENFEDKIET